jgi:acyl-CoA thioesterase-1
MAARASGLWEHLPVRYNLRKFLVLAPIALVAACGSEGPAPQPTEAASAAPAAVPVTGPERRILAFGDSLFAGYNLAAGQGYPARLEAALRRQGINARLVDGAVSGDTSAAGLARLEFVLDNLDQTPDLVLVELGGNDLLRNISPVETRANLTAILQEMADRNLPVLLIGMRAPPNLGVTYQQEFDRIYPELAEHFQVGLVPFFLEPVYDKPDLLQADHIHPTAAGVEALVAATADDVVTALPKPE